MRKSKEILRQKWLLGRSHRAIALATGVSAGAVSVVARRATRAGLDWPTVARLDEESLEARLYGVQTSAAPERAEPDCAWIHRERRRPGVTLDLLHQEYLAAHPDDGYGYTAFCDRYRRWLGRRGLTMRQSHVAGDKLFVDYAGKRPAIVDPVTGEVTEVELFVAVLGASSYTYAEATRSQRGPDWIGSHVRALAFFGGVPNAIVCDQLKTGVARACRYEPGIQRTYEELAHHYGTTVMPARPKRPRDKAKVEVGVQVVERWILARIRNEVFHSLAELNRRIGELLRELNDRTMRHYQKSRRALFTELEQRALRPLPNEPFEYAEWRSAGLNIDYHIVADGHFYSVPHRLVHRAERVEVRMTASTVEIFVRSQRVAVHARSYEPGRHTTIAEHMPSSHRAHSDWSPSRILAWAEKVGPSTRTLCDAILRERRHPEQGYRSCLGILRLGKKHPPERLEAACARALRVGARSYRSVESILRSGLDRVPLRLVDADTTQTTIDHENVRGRGYYR